MSFFNLQRLKRENEKLERAVRDNKLLEERIETLKWQQHNDEYDREQQHCRKQERLDQQRENDREWCWNMLGERDAIREELADLKLRRKFGIEEEMVTKRDDE